MNQGEPEGRLLLERLHATPELFERIAAVPGSELQIQAQLRREFADDLVRAALLIHELRLRGRDRFSRAEQMWFDRRGFEQATPERVARHKAQRFCGSVIDLCCGIGMDAVALAGSPRVSGVTAVDLSPAACLMAGFNADVYEVGDRMTTIEGDARDFLLAGDALVHIDPDRRPSGDRRVRRLEDYQPDLAFLQGLAVRARGGAMKVSPASNFGGKFPGCEIELVSLAGECKEATVWFGELRSEASFRATLLPSGETLIDDPEQMTGELHSLKRYLYDPDPAVVRAGLVDVLAERLGLQRLDDAEEYLTGESLVESNFVTPFEVREELPNNDREIRRFFRTSDIGQLEVKCRHIPIRADDVRRRLPLPGSEPGVLVYARIAGRARALVCRRVPPPVGLRQDG